MESELQPWYLLVGILVGALALFKAYFFLRNSALARTFATKEELKAAVDERDERFDNFDRELVDIQAALKNAPSKEDFHKLSLKLEKVDGEFKRFDEMATGMKAGMSALSVQLDRLYDNELAKGDRP